ncbi:MAG: dienelactone hydrolase family protein [Bacteroidales bacterium]|jgi:carboxymethylenebutenolidase|nr:dienelactone hydrolase family protein [Bacteroidales bacterium]
MSEKMNELYDDFRAGKVDRREFMKKLAIITGGTAAAVFVFPEQNSADASPVESDVTELVNEFITYPGETGEMRAYLSVPKGKKKLPAVIVIHENRGLVPHIQDVNRRMAEEGFLALAPDALSPLGGTPEDMDKGRTMIGQLDRDKTIKNFVAAVKYLKTHPRSSGMVGCTGFCWGGAMTNQVAVNAPELNAAAPYYGSTPAPEDVPKIKAPVMAHYAGNDERINAGIPAFEEALKKAGIEYQIFIYEGTEHGFNNDTNTDRYNKEAADLAWGRTVKFFREKMGG